MSRHRPSINGELRGILTAIIQKAQFVRVGPFPVISQVIIVQSGDTFRLDFNGELREILTAIIQKAQFVRVGPFP